MAYKILEQKLKKIIMKKTPFAKMITLFFVTTSVYGNTNSLKVHRSFALGVHAGHITADNRFQNTYRPDSPTISFIQPTTDQSGRGGIIGLDLSYNYIFAHKLFSGIELKADLQNLKGSSSKALARSSMLKNSIRAKNSFGAACQLGRLIKQFLPYVTIGCVTTKFESVSSVIAGPPFDGGDSHKSKRLTGVEVGVGFDVIVSHHISLGSRYVHTKYQTMRADFRYPSGDIRERINLKPCTNAFTIHIKYRF